MPNTVELIPPLFKLLIEQVFLCLYFSGLSYYYLILQDVFSQKKRKLFFNLSFESRKLPH
jgi:hypothetical protein